MRLLWEENLFGAVGAMIVAAVSLASVWVVLEGIMQLSGGISAVLSALAAVAVLETISRRYYADETPFGETGDRSAWLG